MKVYIKMIIEFGDTKIGKHKFHWYKRPISMKNIDINKIVVSEKTFFGKKSSKYFTGYKDARKTRPLCIFLPKISVYRRDFYGTKYMSFLIKDDEVLEIYTEIWEKVKIVSKTNLIVNLYTIKNI